MVRCALVPVVTVAALDHDHVPEELRENSEWMFR